MKNLYAFTDYKEFLNGYFAGPAAARGLRTRAAEAMQCQPAYLSQVLKGQAELTEDHAYKLGQFLEMTAVQAEYFGLLVRCSRASTPQLRRHLQQQAQALSKKGRGLAPDEPSEELDPQDEKMKKYFSSWLPSTVHFATQCEKYQKPAALAKKLGIDEAKTR